MRGRMNAITADMLTAELRKRLAEINTMNDPTPHGHAGDHGCTLGARALRLARIATAVHMGEAAGRRVRTGETPVPLGLHSSETSVPLGFHSSETPVPPEGESP